VDWIHVKGFSFHSSSYEIGPDRHSTEFHELWDLKTANIFPVWYGQWHGCVMVQYCASRGKQKGSPLLLLPTIWVMETSSYPKRVGLLNYFFIFYFLFLYIVDPIFLYPIVAGIGEGMCCGAPWMHQNKESFSTWVTIPWKFNLQKERELEPWEKKKKRKKKTCTVPTPWSPLIGDSSSASSKTLFQL